MDFEDRWTGSISLPSVIKNTIDNNLYMANVLRWATRAVKGEFRESQPEAPASDYDSYTRRADMEIMLYALARTADLAGERPVYLVVIPTVRDLEICRGTWHGFSGYKGSVGLRRIRDPTCISLI